MLYFSITILNISSELVFIWLKVKVFQQQKEVKTTKQLLGIEGYNYGQNFNITKHSWMLMNGSVNLNKTCFVSSFKPLFK